MKASEMLELLREFYRDKLAQRQRHVAAARHVKDYEINNAYQYVIAREDVQVELALRRHRRSRREAGGRAGT